jgi:glutathione synthase/RimK-type ligase-like ATP-grasp enzyme
MLVGLCNRMAKEWFDDFVQSCAALGLETKTITIGADDWLDQLKGVDIFVWRLTMGDSSCMAEARAKIPLIEATGIHCFPNQLMLWLYDDKIRETLFLRQHACPMPRTWIIFEEASAREFAAKASYPLVAKSHCGASSGGVVLVRSAAQAKALLDRVFPKLSLLDKILVKYYFVPRLAKGDLLVQLKAQYRHAWPRYAYFQEFLTTDHDWRITTLGRDLVSVFVRKNRPDDFRASGSGKWERPGVENFPTEACELALGISNKHGFICMTYDFMKKGDHWVIGEISYAFLHNAIYSDTLFRCTERGFVAAPAMPIGEMHLRAVMAAMPGVADAG